MWFKVHWYEGGRKVLTPQTLPLDKRCYSKWKKRYWICVPIVFIIFPFSLIACSFCASRKVLNLPPKQLSNPHSSRAVTLSKLFNSNRQKQTSPKWRINFYWQSLKKEPYRRRTECIICGLCPLITGVVINIIFVRWRIFDIPPLSSNTQDYHHATIQYSI